MPIAPGRLAPRRLSPAACAAGSLSPVSVSGAHLAGPAARIRPAVRLGLGLRCVATPVPVLRRGATQIDLDTAALSAGWGFRERPCLLVVEQLPGEALSLHDEHDLPAVALR